MSGFDAPPASPLASRVFGFEADFAGDLRCLPMAVRRKLDLAGVKLKLAHWHGLAEHERRRLLSWPDDALALRELHHWLLERSQSLPQGPAKPLTVAADAPWRQRDSLPEVVQASCRQLGLTPRAEGWPGLDELQRFALVKLSHAGHEHRNLPKALEEFGLLPPEASIS
ncbi:MAG: nitrate reductase associated protein [Cyanobacteriota bacterium]|nr:nitrate reductase associated protein [Cyanobacteriota bacterium]